MNATRNRTARTAISSRAFRKSNPDLAKYMGHDVLVDGKPGFSLRKAFDDGFVRLAVHGTWIDDGFETGCEYVEVHASRVSADNL